MVQTEETAPGQHEEREKTIRFWVYWKAMPKGFSDRLDGEVWVKKRRHGGLQSFGVSTWKDGEDLSDTGEGQGWNEVWGKDRRSVLNRLDLSCLLGVLRKMVDVQTPVRE